MTKSRLFPFGVALVSGALGWFFYPVLSREFQVLVGKFENAYIIDEVVDYWAAVDDYPDA